MANNIIPTMTHELGRYWKQPHASLIEIDDTHALMTRATLEAMSEYSTSRPSGVYPGKMWSSHLLTEDRADAPREWYIGWYGIDPGSDYQCTINYRKVLIVE